MYAGTLIPKDIESLGMILCHFSILEMQFVGRTMNLGYEVGRLSVFVYILNQNLFSLRIPRSLNFESAKAIENTRLHNMYVCVLITYYN